MKLSDFDYNLPEASIAKFPPKVRGNSRLLQINRITGKLTDHNYRDLADLIPANSLLILNNTKVVPARLLVENGQKKPYELVILENHTDHNWLNSRVAKVLYRGKLRADPVDRELFAGKLHFQVRALLAPGIAEISSTIPWQSVLDQIGQIPIPPYLKREETAADRERYQTIIAKTLGSVAAPTASLNLTQELLTKIAAKGCQICYLTLHVGLGTFLPVRVANVEEHRMHSEYFEIPKETIQLLRQAKQYRQPVIAVGTTVARTLEYAAKNILHEVTATNLNNISGEADIFIYPGYKFQIVDQLLTNFHAPHSTVLLLAAAFAGWPLLKQAYDYAVSNHYQFLSYGDSTLIQ